MASLPYPEQKLVSDFGQGYWDQYEWIVVCGALAAFFMAWGIGANDVANAFATSVGSKTLKLWQACCIAGVFEFLGAIVLGGEVTKTIATDIARTEYFNNFPEIYMYGMLCSLTSAALWILLATYWSLAVSTTHSIIGAIMGFALVYGGGAAVKWNDCKPDFPWSVGFLPVALSWFISPVTASILSSTIFLLNRHLVLRRKNSTNIAFWMLPILLLLTFFINLLFVLGKGSKKEMEKRWPPVTKYSTHCSDKDNGPGLPRGDSYKDFTDLYNAAAWIAAACASGVAVLGVVAGIPLMRRRYNKDLEEEKRIEAGGAAKEVVEESMGHHTINPELQRSANPLMQIVYYLKYFGLRIYSQLKRGLFYDVHQKVAMDETVSTIHEAAEVFDPHTEQVYKYLQVFSACCVSFGHGANDVANAVGPFAGIWAVYNTWQVPGSNAASPKWILALGGAGLVVGLMTYGYNIIMELGVTLLKLTPSRGFSAELGTGLTVSLASFYGLPVSTTQIIVGAETGVGLCEGIKAGKTGVNLPVLFKTFLGWIATIIVAGLTCAAIFAMGVYSPSVMMSKDIEQYRYGLGNLTISMAKKLNSTNYAFQNALVAPNNLAWWTLPDPATNSGNPLNGSKLNSTLSTIASNVKIVSNAKKDKKYHFYVDPEFAIYWANYSMNLYFNFSALTIGQNATGVKTGGQTVWQAPPKA